MHQVFNICWLMVCCEFMLLMLYLPLLYICGTHLKGPLDEHFKRAVAAESCFQSVALNARKRVVNLG